MNFLLLISLIIYPLSAFLLLMGKRESGAAGLIAIIGSVLAALSGLFPVLQVLSGGGAVDVNLSWSLPLGSFHLHMDPLSAWFSLPVLLIPILTSCYGMGYMKHYRAEFNTKFNWFFLQMLSGGMYFVLLSWDGILFLFAWEIMSFAAWFLVMFDHGKGEVRRAGWVYLAATHLGTAFLFAMFILCQKLSGSSDFSAYSGLSMAGSTLFLLALVGFGSKAGFFGLHVWLPEAHPAAPSHVSGLMSGVMIKLGIYGIIRMLSLLGVWPQWWGWLLIGIGICSGLGAVLYAAVQKDLKQLLAYSSVENIGIICLGLGIGVLGISSGSPVGLIAIAGCLIHVLNHSLFKTALFMSAGSVAHMTGTRNIDSLGGLGKKMPLTALVFLTASLAICGLPPLNGFVSELLIYIGSYKTALLSSMDRNMMLAGFLVISALAFIGGVAVLCFTKVIGIIFLGSSRSRCCEECGEAPRSMTLPMLILAAGCVILGFGGSAVLKAAVPVVLFLRPDSGGAGASLEELSGLSPVFKTVSLFMAAFLLFCLILWGLRAGLLKKRPVKEGATWGCGYQGGTRRMQYSGSSYVEPLLYSFRTLFQSKRKGRVIEELFPEKASFSTETEDLFMKGFYGPLFSAAASGFARFRIIQNGRLNLYIFYIILTLTGVLIWSIL